MKKIVWLILLGSMVFGKSCFVSVDTVRYQKMADKVIIRKICIDNYMWLSTTARATTARDYKQMFEEGGYYQNRKLLPVSCKCKKEKAWSE